MNNNRESFEATDFFKSMPDEMKLRSGKKYANLTLNGEFELFCLGFNAALAQVNANEQSQAQQEIEQLSFDDNGQLVDKSQAQQPSEEFKAAALQELYAFQEATGCDIAAELKPHQLSQAQQERTKLIPIPTEESPRQWFFDCDDLYIDVEHLNGEVSIFVKCRSDDATGWKELIEKSQGE